MMLPRLREWRERRALTQDELAQKAEVSRGTVNRIEQGHEAFPPTVRKLAQALGVDPGELIGAGDGA
jgi:transcriptional regulator with XRE-family HTH domain